MIDPVRTRTAAQADEHLAPRPGTDAALALGLMHEVVRRGAHDEAFLRDAHASAGTRSASGIAEFPPERVAELCDVPGGRIVALGERLATTAAHRDPGDDGHPAPRRRRHGAADAQRASPP